VLHNNFVLSGQDHLHYLKENEHYAEAVRRYRKHLILDVLRACGVNRSKAVRQLGAQRPNLVYLVKKLGIQA